MISVKNVSCDYITHDCDFTVTHYRELLELAKKRYGFSTYKNIPWGQRFVLWRHDVDFSLNRALVLAQMESELGVISTYFVNPHSAFYNLSEVGQFGIVKEIISLGHHLGLHFDASFHLVKSEEELNQKILDESLALKELFGVVPSAFSFHNPTTRELSFEAEYYGGLVNCYSHRFKSEVPYCSDSNGYWRFRRLHDVLSAAFDPCLQVLTHPGWWQGSPMPPRRRLFRSAFGRAKATMRSNDEALVAYGRVNHAGLEKNLRVLADSQPCALELCDFLWNEGHFTTLFVELWRLHEAQINRMCKVILRKELLVSASDVNTFFEQGVLEVDGFRLFRRLFGDTWQVLVGLDSSDCSEWEGVRNLVVHGRGAFDSAYLEQGCVFVCDAIRSLSTWGLAQPIAYDGLVHLGSIGLQTVKMADGGLSDRLEEDADETPVFPNRRWDALKASLGVVAVTPSDVI